MKTTTIAAFTCLFASSCAFSLFPDKPKLTATPYIASVKFDGKARMESAPGVGGVFVAFGPELNVDSRNVAVGGALASGDGFHGLELHFLHLEQKEFETAGTLRNSFGGLLPGDRVQSDIVLDQLRIKYLARVADFSVGRDRRMRIAVGAGLHHNEFKLNALDTVSARRTVLEFQDDVGVPVALARADIVFHPIALRLDAGFIDGDFGEVRGQVLDLAATLEYRVQHGVTAFAGFWRYDLPGSGVQDSRAFAVDSDLTGLLAGIRFDF